MERRGIFDLLLLLLLFLLSLLVACTGSNTNKPDKKDVIDETITISGQVTDFYH